MCQRRQQGRGAIGAVGVQRASQQGGSPAAPPTARGASYLIVMPAKNTEKMPERPSCSASRKAVNPSRPTNVTCRSRAGNGDGGGQLPHAQCLLLFHSHLHTPSTSNHVEQPTSRSVL